MNESDALTELLEEQLQSLTERKQVKHVIMGVMDGEEGFRWIGAAGDARPGRTPMQEDTPYFIASVTKLYIAASILKLHEQKAIDIDGLIAEYLPDSMVRGIHKYKGNDYSGSITIKHLLSHASGLPDWLEDRPKNGKSMLEQIDKEEDRFISVEEAAAFVRNKLTPHFPPQPFNQKKMKIRYSDTNFQLLIAILEQATGNTLSQVFEEIIYRPLGLHNTFHPAQKPDDVPEPAVTWIEDQPFFQPQLLKSFRDLFSTARDQLRFMQGLMSGKLFDHPETLNLMQQWNRFGFPRDMAALRSPGWPIEYGMGMMRLKMPRMFTPLKPVPPIVGHTGATGSWLFYCPKYDLYLCGTVDQITEPALPFRFIPKLLQRMGSHDK